MKTLSIFLCFIAIQVNEPKIKTIYIGKTTLWTVYFDSHKKPNVIEVSGIKFGYLDFMSDGKSKIYEKNGNLYYQNDSLNINTKLKKKKYSDKIDYKRLKLFEIYAMTRISLLNDSLNHKLYNYDWNIKEDYINYRDHDSIPLFYTK